MIILSNGEIAAVKMVNAVLRALLWMQGGGARATQIEIVRTVLSRQLLQKEHKVAIEKAIHQLGLTLGGNWLPIVEHVIRSRIANEQKFQLHATPF
jgi:hypothetical protein